MATFGYTSIGGSQNNAGGGPRGSKFTAPASGTITSLECYITSSGDIGEGVRTAVYADASGSPGAKLAESTEVIQSGGNQDTWISFPLSLAITGSTVYWLVVWGETGGLTYAKYDEPGDVSNQSAYVDVSGYPTWPDPFVKDAFLDWKFSIYATYTPAGGSAFPSHYYQMMGR